ncbi:IclR family transcriptional regulator [Rhodococcus olei]|uniref:IclR family transcriptional regulator n=1 Tax=Rhodococcus olei TaxID=2161675 RepID=A0ABP8P8B3_9NOCA
MTVQPINECAPAPTSVLDRVSVILDAFDGPGRLTLAQVVIRTGIPRASVHRFLENLVRMGWLRRTNGYYQLGLRLFELGSLAVQQDRLHASAEATLHELHRVTGFVVHLGVLDGPDVVYLDKIGGRLAGAVPSRVGGRRDARTAALGKVLLAFSHPESTARAAPDPELQRVVDTGVAYENGDNTPGFSCIAAPIGPAGGAVAAVSICGPATELKCDHRNAAPVRMAASAIWNSLHGAPQRRGRDPFWHFGAALSSPRTQARPNPAHARPSSPNSDFGSVVALPDPHR